MTEPLDIGVVTDEVSTDLDEALELGFAWGLSRFELREGSEERFPFFTDREIRRVEDALKSGAEITAVSPGILKGAVGDDERLNRELEQVLPQSIELAQRFNCSRIITFGFARRSDASGDARGEVLRAFEQAAEQAAAADMTIAIENEPNFWIDRPGPAAALLREIGHPALSLNWDPANQHWGGDRPTRDDFEAIRDDLANVHVKDYTPEDPDVPWRPVGDGITPWTDILTWIIEDARLDHVTLETHCEPLIENSRTSLSSLRGLIAEAAEAATNQ
jgi:sugar phosphate isomerase/epimerase